MKNENHNTENFGQEILCISTFPPRECGIATYSQDLITALNRQFSRSFTVKVCALESMDEQHQYSDKVPYTLNVDVPGRFDELAGEIKENEAIRMVLIQHEFGLFAGKEPELLDFMATLIVPVVVVFHTILPAPVDSVLENVYAISLLAQSVIVMTKASKKILVEDYVISPEKITVIPHGTHLIQHTDKDFLKKQYGLAGKTVLSTFGLLSPGKSIETTLDALPGIVKQNPDIVFLVIGKTHPTIVKQYGEKYRDMLETKVTEMGLTSYVKFVNTFLQLHELLEYLQLTDIYLFTSKDPNQAVSGTFSYAVSCGCPVISTPIPQAKEVLWNNPELLFDFGNSRQLSKAVNFLLKNEALRAKISSEALHQTASTAWENSALAHAFLFWHLMGKEKETLSFNYPAVKLDYLEKMTTDFGFIQFSMLSHPDINSGYTLDDNARAMIAVCQHYEQSRKAEDISLIRIYMNFIHFCQREDGSFLNYVDEKQRFTPQNEGLNLEDANGRAVWALGYLLSLGNILPQEIIFLANSVMRSALSSVEDYHSPRSLAFILKGIYYKQFLFPEVQDVVLSKKLSDWLVFLFEKEKKADWPWFEPYLTYANAVIPEALLDVWEITGIPAYRKIATMSFDFLLSKTFADGSIKVISNKTWLHRDKVALPLTAGGEQPIDIAYTIMALDRFYAVSRRQEYKDKMGIAFSWFLGNNFLYNIIYNPCTGGCYDGLEEDCVNLNQGAESTVCYLISRQTMDAKWQTISHVYQEDVSGIM
ncbi:glycosyltransferase [Rhizosphaericola mali]|uniref:Glycosyltransferase n=1 Tax=Rhizosphaericola mali TaxID=2545455 RepID=A0A5P2G1R2_9BACT|nr:glycosyltransferase [Rhizosphaericola mali]QES88029.1 glycosyltransferase [Rhizosphaericola mali]